MAGPGLQGMFCRCGCSVLQVVGVLDFSLCAISITDFSAPVEWSAGVGGKIWGLLIIMGFFCGRIDGEKIRKLGCRKVKLMQLHIIDARVAPARGIRSDCTFPARWDYVRCPRQMRPLPLSKALLISPALQPRQHQHTLSK